jgi:O-antigen/teichoic acid export membrane protein
MVNIRRSLFFAFLSSNSGTALNFLVTIILARLLTPGEIGIYSIAAVLVSISHIFREFGVSSYLKREKELTTAKIRAAFGILLFTSWSLALILFLVSGAAAGYYNKKEIEAVIQVLALGFIFIPFGAIPMALLAREYRAQEAAMADMFGVVAYATSSIALAYHGLGYMTMAWANLINIVTTSLAYTYFRPQHTPWLPSFRGWGKVMHFGTGTVLTNAITAVNNALPDLVLGKLRGPHSVGIMSKAISTTNIFTQIAGHTLNYATLRFLSQKHHANESLAEPIQKGVSYVTVFYWPILIATAIFAEPIIRFLYGVQWLECVPVIRIVCLSTAISTLTIFNGTALTALGRPYLSAVPGTIQLLATAAMITILYTGTLTSFAYALLAATAITFPIHLWLQRRHLRIKTLAFLISQKTSLIISLLLSIYLLLLNAAISFLPTWAKLLTLVGVTTPLWLYLVHSLQHPIMNELIALAARYPLLRTFFRAPKHEQ